MDAVITTIQKAAVTVENAAKDAAVRLSIPYVDRERRSLSDLKEQYRVKHVLVMTQNGPVVHTPGGEYFFHLSMAELRIKNILNGKPDHMVAAMGLVPGMSVLDCTLGLATDAIVASFVSGSCGAILGLEASPVISFIVAYGLKNHDTGDKDVNAALRRITVTTADYNQELERLPDKSFDVVFLDPMFRRPINSSSNLKPLRDLTDNRPLEIGALEQARRIAKQRVVIKEANHSPEFERLKIEKRYGGKYSRVCYGIIEAGG
jgi:hypothetical protein